MTKNLLGLLAASAALLGVAAAPAVADNLRASFTILSQSWLTGTAQNIRLTDGGATIISFTNPRGGIVSVTYTAECELIAAPSSSLAVTVFIDSIVVPPATTDAAFCSGRGAGIGGGWSRNSITVAKVLTAGTHSVRVVARVFGPHTFARLDDTSLLIAR